MRSNAKSFVNLYPNRRVMCEFLLGSIVAVGLGMPMTPTSAQEVIRIGVIAHRGEIETMSSWSKLVEHFGKVLGLPSQLIPIRHDRNLQAIASGQVDFILTNPLIAGEIAIANQGVPLASLVTKSGDRFGGVIIASKQSGAQSSADLKGKRLIASSPQSAGAYLFQAYHLRQRGVEVTRDFRQVQTAPKQDDIVLAVRRGLFDVGFIRTGVLEDMVTEKKLSMDDIVIIDRVTDSGYPQVHSTSLYPEWVLLRSPRVAQPLYERLKSAAIAVAPDSEAARAAGIVGFSEPQSLDPIIALIRAMTPGQS